MSDATASRNDVSRPLLIALGVVAALALLYFFVISPLLLSDDSPDEVAAPVVPAPTATDDDVAQGPDEPGADEPVAGDNAPADPVPETFEVFSARDPFQQLVPEGDGSGAASADGTAGDGSSDDGSSDDGSSDDGSSGSDGGASDDDSDDVTVGGTTVTLVDVVTGSDGSEQVQVTVNGTGYQVGEGETFATNFKVLEIADSCATFLFGDSRFVLCEGEAIRK